MEAKRTALQAASGRRAHQRCRVEGWPCRMDFSRAEAALMASSGSATSMSFLWYGVSLPPSQYLQFQCDEISNLCSME